MITHRHGVVGLLCVCLASTGAARDGHTVTVAQGRTLFTREWVPNDPLAGGDGLGPLYNAASCSGCHRRVRPGGAGEGGGSLFVGGRMLHQHSTDPDYADWRREQMQPRPGTFRNEDGELEEGTVRPSRSVRDTPALWGAGLIDAVPIEAIAAQLRAQPLGISGRMPRDADGQPGRFGWKADVSRLGAFVQQACSNELGLSVQGVPQPALPYREATPQKAPDLSPQQVFQLTTFVRSLPRPDRLRSRGTVAGELHFAALGCAGCHTPDLGGVEGLYSDLLLHDMGPELASTVRYYGKPEPIEEVEERVAEGVGAEPAGSQEWRTPPLWGVADSAPYLHDGRGRSLSDAIKRHGGEASAAQAAWVAANDTVRGEVIAFLLNLRAPPPPLTLRRRYR